MCSSWQCFKFTTTEINCEQYNYIEFLKKWKIEGNQNHNSETDKQENDKYTKKQTTVRYIPLLRKKITIKNSTKTTKVNSSALEG